jgi:uncharacterized caspase-like protein/type II secretory pathway pseudopilin PulG
MAKVALLIGVSEYEPGLTPLPGAMGDVEAWHEVLLHPEMGGFEAEAVQVLKNPQRQGMEEAIERLFMNRKKDDLVLLVFSGHGIKDDRGKLYLATRTTRKEPTGELIRSTAVAASVIHENMNNSRSRRQIVILDSCFSGAFAQGMSAKDDGTVDIRTQLGGEGRVVLASSSSTQYSFEQAGQNLSVYTHFLLEGIKTGDADLDEDGIVAIHELHEYAREKVQEAQPAMKPEIYTIKEGFKIYLAKVPPGDPKKRYRKEVAQFSERGEVSIVGRYTLNVLRESLGLSAHEAQAIEDEVLATVRETLQRKQQQYAQALKALLTQQQALGEIALGEIALGEIALGETDRAELKRFQETLGLRDEITTQIEQTVRTEIQAYQKNLDNYAQVLTQRLLVEDPLSSDAQQQLLQIQEQYNLEESDLAVIEGQVKQKIVEYRQNLEEYRQHFYTVVRQEYPLSDAKRQELCKYREQLNLTEKDYEPIEVEVKAEFEGYLQKLQHYQEAFTKAIESENSLTDATRGDLERLQQVLNLSQDEVKQLESKVFAQKEGVKLVQSKAIHTYTSQQAKNPRDSSQPIPDARMLGRGTAVGDKPVNSKVTKESIGLQQKNNTKKFKVSSLSFLIWILGVPGICVLLVLLVSRYQEQVTKARESEAKQYVGAMGRAQQAFYLENETFTNQLDQLGFNISSTTTNYRYRIELHRSELAENPENPNYSDFAVISIGQARRSDLRSYIGIVSLIDVDDGNYKTTVQVLCSTNKPSMNPSILLADTKRLTEPYVCPIGTSKVD